MKLFLPVVSATLSNPSWKVTKEVTGIEVRGAHRLNLAELSTFFESKQKNGKNRSGPNLSGSTHMLLH